MNTATGEEDDPDQKKEAVAASPESDVKLVTTRRWGKNKDEEADAAPAEPAVLSRALLLQRRDLLPREPVKKGDLV